MKPNDITQKTELGVIINKSIFCPLQGTNYIITEGTYIILRIIAREKTKVVSANSK